VSSAPLTLPDELTMLTGELGARWPRTDEVRLLELARAWIRHGAALGPLAAEAETAVHATVAAAPSEATDELAAYWGRERSAGAALASTVTGAPVVGAAVAVCAGVVLALKVNIVVQLTVLAVQIHQAVVAAPTTCGVSLTAIPVYRGAADLLVDHLTRQAAEVIGG
jgi:hypothetical protein